MAAVIRHDTKHGYVLVLCPLGHLIEAHRLDGSFGGSAFHADLSFRHPGDRFDRLAAKCQGAGHKETPLTTPTLTYDDGRDIREGDIVEALDGPRIGQRGKVLDPAYLDLVSIRWNGEPLEHFGYLAPQALKLVRRSQAGRAK